MHFSKAQKAAIETAAKDHDLDVLVPLYQQLANSFGNRKWSNIDDIKQEVMLGMLMALKTYDKSKGTFVGWASYYIKTRFSRAKQFINIVKIPERHLKNAERIQVVTLGVQHENLV